MVTGKEALRRVIKGANFACDAIKMTYGPHGRNFASGVHGGPLTISNDGVSLARELVGMGGDEIEELGIRAVSEGCIKTNDLAGDGTTGAAILMQAILGELDRQLHLTDDVVHSGDKTAAQLIEQVNKECRDVVDRLSAIKQDVESKDDLVAVARVSGEYPELAELIGEAQWKVGKYGTVLVEENNAATDSVEYIHGIRIDNGYTSSRIINHPEKQSLELSDVKVILTSHYFAGTVEPIMHIIKKIANDGGGNVLLMARGFDDAVIGWCVKQIQESSLKVFPVNAPYVDQNEVMEDLAAVIGGRYINTGERNLETMLANDVGMASKITFKRSEGIVSGYVRGINMHVDDRIDQRCEKIDKELLGDISPFERRHLESRLAQLRAGAAKVKVGAETEQERKHKKDKADDAVNAVKAAFTEGVVAGAGMGLMKIADSLPDSYLIKEALRAPYKQIKALAPKDFEIAPWVRDPLKVVRVGLEKACSIASSLATTEVAINYEREKPQYVTSVDNKIRDTSEDL